MISAGELDKRVTLQSKSSTRNSFGEQVDGWADLATVWAGKKLLTMKDVARAQGQSNQAEIKFLVRHRSDVTTAMRLTYKGEAYLITELEETLDGTGLFIHARKAR